MLILAATQQPLAELLISVAICGIIVTVVSWNPAERWQNGRIEAIGITTLAAFLELESFNEAVNSQALGAAAIDMSSDSHFLMAVKIFLLFATVCLFIAGASFLANTGADTGTARRNDVSNASTGSVGNMLNIEYYILTLLSLVGTLYLLSTDDTLCIYLCIELQTLAFYVLASFLRNSEFSTEAGFKYFVLGSLSSGLLLFGLSLLYLLTGLTTLSDIAELFLSTATSSYVSTVSLSTHSLSVALALTFIMAALFFKIGIAPFHLWVPDVYEGAPTVVTALFAVIPKLPLVLLLTKVLLCVSTGDYSSSLTLMPDLQTARNEDIFSLIQPFFLVACILSIALGSFGAILQQRIKRLLAFSTIAHMGFLLIPLTSALSFNAAASLYFYIFIYLLMSLALFTIVLSLNLNSSFTVTQTGKGRTGLRRERPFIYITDLKNLVAKNKLIALSTSIVIFSMAGVPPLPGFYSKFHILLHAFATDAFYLALAALFISIVSAVYYLYIIHSMFFVEVPERQAKGVKITSLFTATVLSPIAKGNAGIVAALIASMVFLSVISPGILLDTCQLWAITTVLSS